MKANALSIAIAAVVSLTFFAGCGVDVAQKDVKATGESVAETDLEPTPDNDTEPAEGSGSASEKDPEATPANDTREAEGSSSAAETELEPILGNDTEPTEGSGSASEEEPKATAANDTNEVKASATEQEKAATPEAEATAQRDWPMWGGSSDRNMVAEMTGVTTEFNMEDGKNVVWSQGIGSQTYGNPVVAGGKVYVGTNNGGGFRPKHPKAEDKGILLCFDEKSGEFQWQLTREKLNSGRVNDWPLQGICSTPVIEGDRLWVVTNRCELMCLDTEGFADGENDGVDDEVDSEKGDADIIWTLDMMGEELGVFPHNLATSSPVIHGDNIYILTSNGVDEAHLEVPSPRAPCFLCVNKNTGEVVWEAGQPGGDILHGQWGSPSVGMVNGKAQVYFPGGDGWLYAHDAETGDEIWKFDLNPKETKWELGGAGQRNSIIATPVFHENSVILAVGQDPEHGEGVGHLWRVDATKTGDVSAELGEIQSEGKPNPNSAVIWHYGGTDDEDEAIYRRTMSTVAIKDGMLVAADLSGFIHCIDFKTGKRNWVHDLFSGVWGSPIIVDGKIFIGNEDGTLTVFKATPDKAEVLAEASTANYSAIYSTPTFANGKLFLSDRARVYCIDVQAGK